MNDESPTDHAKPSGAGASIPLGGRRLLTGNHEGEFGLWDGSEFFVAVFLERPCAHHLCLKFAHNFIVLFLFGLHVHKSTLVLNSS